MIFMVSR